MPDRYGGDYAAYVSSDGSTFARGTVRLQVRQGRGPNAYYLMADSSWKAVEDAGVVPDDMGLVLPLDAVEAVLEACEEYLGRRTHASTAEALLREALKVERDRVDAVLHRAIAGGRAT